MEEPSTAQQIPISAAAVASSAAVAAAAGSATQDTEKKRKLEVEDVEFRSSKYFNIRAIARDLRASFIEVLRAPDFRSSKAAQDILKKMNFMVELSKEMREDSSSPVKPKKSKNEPPMTEAKRDAEMGMPQGGETHAPPQPQAGEIHIAPANPTVTATQPEKPPKMPEKESVSTRVKKTPEEPEKVTTTQPEKPPNKPEKELIFRRVKKVPEESEKVTATQPEKPPNMPEKEPIFRRVKKVPEESEKVTATQSEKPPNMPEKEHNSRRVKNVPEESGKQPVEGCPGSYVIGGSPIGWNFLMYPSGLAVYCGITKETARLRRAGK